MARSHKQNGTEAETAVRRYLAWWWPEVCRLAPAGAADAGDLGGIPELCVQVKRQAKLALSTWIDETRAQAAIGHKPYFIVIHKRIRKGNPADWYVTLPLGVFAPIYAAACHEANTPLPAA